MLELSGSNLILKDKKLSLKLRNLFFSIEEEIKEAPQAKARFEPKNNDLNKPKREVKFDKIPNLLAWWESLRTVKWEKLFPDPGVSLQQINRLLTIA